MATLSELRTRIANKLSDGDLIDPTSAQIDQAINYTIDYYETDKFWFSEEIANLTTTVNDPILASIPSDFKQEIMPNGLVVIQGQVRFPLIKLTPLEYDTLNVEGQGLPRWYTYRKGQFELYNYPDQAYSINLFYRKTYADLSADDDENDFTNNATRLIEYKTLADLFADYRANDPRSDRYEQKAHDEFIKIKRETNNRTVTGFLTTENIVERNHSYYSGYY